MAAQGANDAAGHDPVLVEMPQRQGSAYKLMDAPPVVPAGASATGTAVPALASAAPTTMHTGGKKPDSDDGDSSSDEESIAGLRLTLTEASKQANQFILVDYDDLVAWLSDHVIGASKERKFVHDWKRLFFSSLPLFMVVRTQRVFKDLVEFYENLDPTMPPRPAPVEATRVLPNKVAAIIDNPKVDTGTVFMNDHLEPLMHAAGFARTPLSVLQQSKKLTSQHGLDVHTPSSKDVEVVLYHRGTYTRERMERSWRKCFCGKVSVEEAYFRTLVTAYQFHTVKDDTPLGLLERIWWLVTATAKRQAIGPEGSEGKVFIRAYHDVPLADIDMLWPGSTPNPTVLDIALIFIPFLGGFAVGIWKLVELVRDNNNLGDIENLMVILFAIIAPLSLSFRYFNKAQGRYFKYKEQQARMRMELVDSTNRGAMLQMLAEATHQENKEVCLAYSALAVSSEPLDSGSLKSSCEARLVEMDPDGGRDVIFDVDGATASLERLGLAVRSGAVHGTSGGRATWLPVEPAAARGKLSLAQFDDNGFGHRNRQK